MRGKSCPTLSLGTGGPCTYSHEGEKGGKLDASQIQAEPNQKSSRTLEWEEIVAKNDLDGLIIGGGKLQHFNLRGFQLVLLKSAPTEEDDKDGSLNANNGDIK